MATRTRSYRDPTTETEDVFGFDGFDLDHLSEEELDALLFDEEPKPRKGFWNFPTMTGLSLIVVGVTYLMQQMGLLGGDLTEMIALLPWLAGVLIILLGFGVLSWRPSRSRRKRKRKKAETKARRRRARRQQRGRYRDEARDEDDDYYDDEDDDRSWKRPSRRWRSKKERLQDLLDDKGRLTRSERDRKILGVCGGIAERLNIDSTLVRIAFVIGIIASGGWPFILAYFALAYVMPDAEEVAEHKRVRIRYDD